MQATLPKRVYTEDTLIDVVMRDRWQKNFCLPRYTPRGWWECDMFELTTAGFFREYEVKLSVADFRADKGKARDLPMTSDHWVEMMRARDAARKAGQPDPVRPSESKHELLSKGDPRGPSQFYYVTPVGLLDDEALPLWAGWLEVYPYDDTAKDGSLYMRSRVEAPRIHRVKMKDDPNHHRGTCYYRMHRSGRAHAA